MIPAWDQVRALLDEVQPLAAGTPQAERLATIRARLEGPLRIAIAGRVKAGKSTLLNALVGERLAPTDAGECTKLVAWFHEAISYEVHAIRRDGSRVELGFARRDGALDISLGQERLEDLDRLDIGWPASVLHDATLIDTPGLASVNDEHSLRTREFLAFGEDRPSDADAVIYLMRHLHSRDAEFLDAFLDRSVAGAVARQRDRGPVARRRDRRLPARRDGLRTPRRGPLPPGPDAPRAVLDGGPGGGPARRDGPHAARDRGGGDPRPGRHLRRDPAADAAVGGRLLRAGPERADGRGEARPACAVRAVRGSPGRRRGPGGPRHDGRRTLAGARRGLGRERAVGRAPRAVRAARPGAQGAHRAGLRCGRWPARRPMPRGLGG